MMMCLLCCLLQERRKYGKLGWNVPYDFNETDFRISLALINTYLGKALTGGAAAAAGDAIPWATLSYLIGEAMYGKGRTHVLIAASVAACLPGTRLNQVNDMFEGLRYNCPPAMAMASTAVDVSCGSSCKHLLLAAGSNTAWYVPVLVCAGGRVSDSFDQRVLTTYLEEYFGDFLFDTFQPFHFFVGRDGDCIGVPSAGPRDVYTKAIDALPLVQSPEVRMACEAVSQLVQAQGPEQYVAACSVAAFI